MLSHKNNFTEYLITGYGLKLLKDRFPKYIRTKAIAQKIYTLSKNQPTAPLLEEAPQAEPVQSKKTINQIINVKEENGELLISGRELHEFLGVKSRYNDWIVRMLDYGFESEIDYTKILVQCIRGQNQYDHALKIDMAKEIAMAQKNEKGKEARQYFIKCEKQLKQIQHGKHKQEQTYEIPRDFKEALKIIIKQLEVNEKLQSENKDLDDTIKIMKPKSDYCDIVLQAEGAVNISVIAKDYGMTAVGMNKLLHELN